jgi:hypothetical protein
MWALAIARVRRSPIRRCLATWFSLSMAALPSPTSTLHLNVTLRGTDAPNNSLGEYRATVRDSQHGWPHEIKYDGYRLRVERNGDRVRLITKGGYNWTDRYPWIVEAALKNRHRQFVIDGEAVVLGVDGYSDFNALHSGKHNEEV